MFVLPWWVLGMSSPEQSTLVIESGSQSDGRSLTAEIVWGGFAQKLRM